MSNTKFKTKCNRLMNIGQLAIGCYELWLCKVANDLSKNYFYEGIFEDEQELVNLAFTIWLAKGVRNDSVERLHQIEVIKSNSKFAYSIVGSGIVYNERLYQILFWINEYFGFEKMIEYYEWMEAIVEMEKKLAIKKILTEGN